MQVSIAMRHGHLSEATQEKIKAKVEKLPRFFDRLTAIEVTVDLEHPGEPLVELVASAEQKHDLVSHEKAQDLMRAVDGAIQKLEQQLRKYKEKVQDRHRQGSVRHQEATQPDSAE